MTKRQKFSDQSKAKIALAALRGDRTIQEVAAKHIYAYLYVFVGLAFVRFRNLDAELFKRVFHSPEIGSGRTPSRGELRASRRFIHIKQMLGASPLFALRKVNEVGCVPPQPT